MQLETIVAPGDEWDAFVASASGSTLGHAAAWAQILRDAYRIPTHYLAARGADGALAGLLPLASCRTLRGELELISLPFLDTAGILTTEPDAERILRSGARDLARELGASAVELRQPTPLRDGPPPGEQSRVDIVLPLEESEEAQWKALRAKVRNQTRKAERSGLQTGPAGPARGRVPAFFAPFAVNMRDLGSPTHARRFFEVAADVFGERLSIHLALLGEHPVGGLVAIDYAGTVSVPWASTLRSERARCPNNLIYWEAIRWAIGRGACSFDFGRSPRDSGTHRFKLGWGGVERELAWTRFAANGEPLVVAGAGPGTMLQRLSEVWKRLPVPVATALGGRLRRFIAN